MSLHQQCDGVTMNESVEHIDIFLNSNVFGNIRTLSVIFAVIGFIITGCFLQIIRRAKKFNNPLLPEALVIQNLYTHYFWVNRSIADLLACAVVVCMAVLALVLDEKSDLPAALGRSPLKAIESIIFYGCYAVVMATYIQLFLFHLFASRSTPRAIMRARCFWSIAISWLCFWILTGSAIIATKHFGHVCWFEDCSMTFYLPRYILSITLGACYLATVLLLIVKTMIDWRNNVRVVKNPEFLRFVSSPVINAVLFTVLYLPYAIWSIFFLLRADSCLYRLHRPLMLTIYTIIQMMIQLRIIVDPIITVIGDTLYKEQLDKYASRIKRFLQKITNCLRFEDIREKVMDGYRAEADRRQTDINQVIRGGQIGKGHTAIVFKGEFPGNHRFCALKCFPTGYCTKRIEMECFTLRKLGNKHPNIVYFFGRTRMDEQEMLSFELMELGNLQQFVKCNKPYTVNAMDGYVDETSDYLSANDLIDIAVQMARGFAYMADHNIVHCDLAARNFLVTRHNKFRIALCDFGMARHILPGNKITGGNYGFQQPERWRAPECVSELDYNFKTDVWSFGIAVWELFSYGEQPYSDILEDENVMPMVKTGRTLANPINCPQRIAKIMHECWNMTPCLRSTAETLYYQLKRFKESQLQPAATSFVCLACVTVKSERP